jgi:hypothetical protein
MKALTMSLVANCKFNALPFVIALALTVLLQWHGGAYRSEYGGHPDEAAHFVTGLMIRDYVAGGIPQSPMAFAKDYYDHYPKVALGNWPPIFYVIQAAWTLPFSPNRISVLLLMAGLTAFVATLLFHLLRSEHGLKMAGLGAVFFICLPLIQQHAGMVMTEIPIALFTLLAVVFFGRFLESERTSDSLLFGLFASVAIMTKGSGLMLALVPPLAVAFARKWHLLKRVNFWYAVPIVLVLCGPWTWKFRDVARAGWMEENPSWHFTKQAAVYYPLKLVLAVGFLLMAFVLVGLAVRLSPKFNGGLVRGRWAAVVALLISGLLFHALVPCGLEPRHLVPLLGPLILLAVTGICGIHEKLLRSGVPSAGATCLLAAVLLFALVGLNLRAQKKAFSGFTGAATVLLTRPEAANAVLFVSSDARGEGQFISEVAVREKRPGHIVRRASKILASSTWGGDKYQTKASDEAGLIALLAKEKIEFLVLDATIPPERLLPHHKLLRSAVERDPGRFTLVGKFPASREQLSLADGIAVYQLKMDR